MPSDTRATVRSLAAFGSTETPPEAFGRFPTIGDGSGLVASLELLVDAAKEAGKLDELAEQAKLAVEKKRENAEALWTLVEVARGHASEVEPALKALLAEWSKKPGRARHARPSEWTCARRPSPPLGPAISASGPPWPSRSSPNWAGSSRPRPP